MAGIEIARRTQNYFQTRLLPNSVCYSSCAIIFMAGSYDEIELFEIPREQRDYAAYAAGPARTITPTSRLGFHAPFVDYRDRLAIPREEVEETLQSSLFLTTFLLSETQGNFPLELATEAMLRGPDDLYFVDEVGQLNSWNISLDSDYHPELTIDLFRRAWITFAHRYANGTPGYGSVGDPSFGVVDEEPDLWGTSGWNYDVFEGITPSGARYLQASNVGREASFGAVFIDYQDSFQLRVLTSDFASEIARYDISGWQLAPPRLRVDQLR